MCHRCRKAACQRSHSSTATRRTEDAIKRQGRSPLPRPHTNSLQVRSPLNTLLNPAATAQRFWQPHNEAAVTFLSPQSSQSSLLLLLFATARPPRLCELPLRAAMPPVGGRRLPALLALGGGTE